MNAKDYMDRFGQTQQAQLNQQAQVGGNEAMPELYVTIEARLRKAIDSNGYNIERLESIICMLADTDLDTDFNMTKPSGLNKLGLLENLTDITDDQANRINYLINRLETLV